MLDARRAVQFESCVAPQAGRIWALRAEGLAGVRTNDEVKRPAGEIPKHQAAIQNVFMSLGPQADSPPVRWNTGFGGHKAELTVDRQLTSV